MKKRINKQEKKSAGRQTVQKPKTLNQQPRSHWVWTGAKLGLLSLCIVSVAIPVLLRVTLAPDDLSRPSDLGLNHTINFYLDTEEGVKVGVWYTVPERKWNEAQGQGIEWYWKALGDGSPIFIYLHGNTGNRSASHRIGVVNVLSGAGYHVFSFDYRGFGDSSGQPTEAGLTTDALCLYNWVKARSGKSLVIVWGHSLGTGVTTNTAVKLLKEGRQFDGIILEGAFLNTRDITTLPGLEHPFTWFYWKLSFILSNPVKFIYFLHDPFKNVPLHFPTDENLKKIKSPLMIFHAEDDHLVPFSVAQELHRIAKKAQGSEGRVKLVPFDGSLGYLHNGLYRDRQLPQIIREFVQSLMP